jgi:RND superfamily putative drug exporter
MADDGKRRGRFAMRYARAVRFLRWFIVVAWIGGAVAATVTLPALSTAGNTDLGSLVPAHSRVVATEKRMLRDFAFPLESNTVVVIHDADGLPPLTQLDVVLYAFATDQRFAQSNRSISDTEVLGALPVLNTANLFPTSHHAGTTAITYLFFSPSASLPTQKALAEQYADHFRGHSSASVAVTGTVPARVEQSNLLLGHLQLVEIVTLVLVALIVAVTFRSLIAPVVLLASAFLSYLVGVRVLGYMSTAVNVTVPPSLEPLVVALILGILTDYSVFFLTGLARHLAAGEEPRDAFELSVRDNISIVAVAGLTVAAGTGALYASNLQLFKQFGPGLAISVIIGAVSAITFVPAAMAILGRRVYWPSSPGAHGGARERPKEFHPSRTVRFISRRPGAAVAGVLGVAALLGAAYPLFHVRLDTSFISSLPANQESSRGAAMVKEGFAYGVLAPTTVLITGPQVKGDSAGLSRLQSEISHDSGVAGVLGPTSIPFLSGHGVFVSQTQPEVRYLVFLKDAPLGGSGISEYRELRDRMPAMLSAAGLQSASVDYGGDTAIASMAADETVSNLELVFGVAFAAEFVILALFLGALLAPLILLALSSLVVLSSLGLTTWVFQDHVNAQGLTFYAPFATTVLLLSLGSDYNVFGTGRIWEEAHDRPLRRAIRRALPESARAITTAGLTLAASFAVIALIPLRPFREMAFTMAVGLLIDTFLVRSVLTPALLTLVGPIAGWPSERLRKERAARPEPYADLSQPARPLPSERDRR